MLLRNNMNQAPLPTRLIKNVQRCNLIEEDCDIIILYWYI